MDRDVEAKMTRLCDRYVQAASQVNLLRPAQLPPKRQATRIQMQVQDVLGRLRTARKPSSAALLRLAYVRGLRSSKPGARLQHQHEGELSSLVEKLDRLLSTLEDASEVAFRRHFRQLIISKASRGSLDLLVANSKPYPLEHHARAAIRNVVETATEAGSLAATRSFSYAEADE